MKNNKESYRFSLIHDLPFSIQRALIQELANNQEESWVPPEIINPTTPEGKLRLETLNATYFDQSDNALPGRVNAPFHSAVSEFLSLKGHYEKQLARIGLNQQASQDEIAQAYRQLFKNQVLAHAQTLNIEISAAGIDQLTAESILFKDVARLTHELMSIESTDDFSDHARFIWDENEHALSLYVSEEIDSILKKTRMLGLVPYEVIDKLSSTKILVLGASVAASTIDLLVAMGARNIEFIDDGELDPSNGQKMPAGVTADYNSNGKAKVYALAKNIYTRNPYGDFIARKGRAVVTEEEKRSGPQDILLSSLITDDTGLVIEVVDDSVMKMKIRLIMEEKYPEIPLLFIADVGNNAFAGLEDVGKGKYFNQQLSDSQLEFLKKLGTEGLSSPLDAITGIFLMVKDQLPEEHKLQALTGRFGGIVPFLSQTGIAARQSASIAVSEFVSYLQGKDVIGRNIQQGESSLAFVDNLSPLAQKTLDEIFDLVIKCD